MNFDGLIAKAFEHGIDERRVRLISRDVIDAKVNKRSRAQP
jgi:hypothetical protein